MIIISYTLRDIYFNSFISDTALFFDTSDSKNYLPYDTFCTYQHTMEKLTVLDIAVSLKSSRPGIHITDDDVIRVSLSSPPVDGRANAELLALFSKRLKIPKSSIEIISGRKSRKKRISIIGLTESEARAIIQKP